MSLKLRQRSAFSLIFLLITSITVPVSAQGPIGALSVGQIIDQLEASAKGILEEAGHQARSTVMEAAQSALMAIGTLRAAYAESLDKTFDEINSSERAAFEDVRALIQQAESGASNITRDLGNISQQLSDAVAQLPGAKRLPIVRSAAPLFFVPKSGAVQVTLTGTNLEAGDPFLLVGGRRLDPIQKLHTTLTFKVPLFLPQQILRYEAAVRASLLRGDIPLAQLEPQLAQLVVYEKTSVFFGLGGSKLEPQSYSVALFPVPSIAGRYQVIAKRRIENIERAPRRSPGYRCESDNGERTRNVDIQVSSTEGWRIDTTTLRFEASYSNHGNQNISTASPEGFKSTLSCSGYGRVEAFGVVIDAGSKGVIQGNYVYEEIRVVAGDELMVVGEDLLVWDRDVPILNLPPDTLSVSVVLNTFNGQLQAWTGQGGHRFYSVDYNRVAQTLIIHPKPLDVALKS